MDAAAFWLAGSVLIMLGFIAIIIGIVVVNNIIHKYWKPVKIFTPDSWTAFNPPQVRKVEPHAEETSQKI